MYCCVIAPAIVGQDWTFFEGAGKGSSKIVIADRMGIKVNHSLHIIGNKRFSKDLFCDAWLTKDGVTLIPVHRVILAGVSDKFKKLFQREEGGGRVHVVPLLDFDILKRVVNFIYDGQIVLKSQEEHDDFMDALATLKVEVNCETFYTLKVFICYFDL